MSAVNELVGKHQFLVKITLILTPSVEQAGTFSGDAESTVPIPSKVVIGSEICLIGRVMTGAFVDTLICTRPQATARACH